MTPKQDSQASENATERSSRSLSRRNVLQSAVVGGLATSSGCLGGEQQLDGDNNVATPVEETALETGLAARPAVLKIGAGTGWLLDDGVVATCSHVVRSETVAFETFDGQEGNGEVIDRNDDLDLALVESALDDIGSLDRFDGSVSEGQPVVKVGHPDAAGMWIVSFGRIVRTRADELVADVPCGPGDSGSPLLTLGGKVVGHVTGSTTLVETAAGLDRPESLVQNYEGQRHVSRAHHVEAIAQHR